MQPKTALIGVCEVCMASCSQARGEDKQGVTGRGGILPCGTLPAVSPDRDDVIAATQISLSLPERLHRARSEWGRVEKGGRGAGGIKKNRKKGQKYGINMIERKYNI